MIQWMQAAPVLTVDWLKTVVDLGAFALLAWLIYVWVSKEMPKRDAAYLESANLQREQFLRYIAEERAENTRAQEQARSDYLLSEGRLWETLVDAQKTQRTDYLSAAHALAEQHYGQLQAQRESYERRALLERESCEKQAAMLSKAIQGLADVVVGKTARELTER